MAPVTPYRIWLAVVAVSGLSYLTYLVQRYRPISGGSLFPALLGGAYSSTVTTVVLAKRWRETAARRPELAAVAAAVLIAASANNLAKAGYAIGFGGFTAAQRTAVIPVILALLGLAASAAYLV